MKMSRNITEALDIRRVAYNPSQEVEGPLTMVSLVCPIHGSYEAPYRRLWSDYTKHNLRSPQCPGCKKNKLHPNEHVSQVKYRLRHAQGKSSPPGSEPHPDWQPMEHWR